MDYTGDTAFLTGGASGIGRAVTGLLVRKGIKIFIVDSNGAGAEAVAKEHNNDTSSPMVWSAQADVSDWESLRRSFELAIEVLGGRIDYVLPIAGIGERRSFPNKPNSTTFEKPDLKVIEVDEIGVFYTVSLAVQHFRRLKETKHGFKGKIMAVASVCGFYIHTTIPLYTAAKHAVVGFVRSFGKILGEESITFNAVCPNKIRTGISTAEVYDKAEKLGVLVPMEKLLEAFEKQFAGQEYGDLTGECFEVAPELGIRIVPKTDFVNEESRLSAEMTYERSHHLHEVVDG